MLDHPNKVAIIGDMLELGSKSADLHKSIVPLLAASGVRKVFLVGEEVSNIFDSMPVNIDCTLYASVDLLLSEIDKLISNDELILIKGSKGIKLFKVAEHFGVKDAI
jgi:UDP-N-acetylmuramoyl-tripeptide--D-alanyl-D-alanine ligase